MHILLLVLPFLSIVTSSGVAAAGDVVNDTDVFYDHLEKQLDDGEDDGNSTTEHHRRPWQDMDNEPPEGHSQIANLFREKMLHLLKTNEGQYVDSIAKYTNAETELLSCHYPGEKMNFAKFNQLMKHLFLYFKQVDVGPDFSFTTGEPDYTEFSVQYKAVSQDGKDVTVTWKGQANKDAELGYFVFSKLEMVGDCAQIPEEFPTGPTEPLDKYVDRLHAALQNHLFQSTPRPQMASFNAFAKNYLISRARVQFCEKNGKVEPREYLANYLFKRYEEVVSSESPTFTTEKHTDYQTDAFFTITVKHPNGDVSRDQYRFRISAQSEVIHGWPHWWVDYVEVMCPVVLNSQEDPKAVQEQFMNRVCDSIGPIINEGPSVEARTTFLGYMNKREDSGFWAIVCGEAGPMVYDKFETWLGDFANTYKESRLETKRIDDDVNFSVACNVELTKENGGSVVKREFKMKAYFETDQWLVKEVKIGCEA